MASGSVGAGTKKFVGQYAFFSGSFPRGMSSIEGLDQGPVGTHYSYGEDAL